MSNYKLRDSNSLDTRQPHEPRGEQPAREGDEWRVEYDPQAGSAAQVVEKTVYGKVVRASTDDVATAKRIVTDRARSALVPGLVAALRLSLLERVEMNGRCDHEPNISEDCFQCHLRRLIAAARKAGVE